MVYSTHLDTNLRLADDGFLRAGYVVHLNKEERSGFTGRERVLPLYTTRCATTCAVTLDVR